MPRFFFDFRQAGELSPDVDGIEFLDAENAYLQTFKAAQEMWSELLAERQDPRQCAFEIRDKEGRLLFIVPFTEVVEICDQTARKPNASTAAFEELRLTNNYAIRMRNELQRQITQAREQLRATAAMISEVS